MIETTTTNAVGNPVPGLGQAQKCGGVKQINECSPIWISNGNINIYKR
jgi:hypothetical protein